MILIILSILLFIAYAGLIIFYRQNWLKCKEYKKPGNSEFNNKPQVFITVIIPSRNEEKEIGACLDSMKAQTYPTHFYEVIVADDFSTDHTAKIVESFSGGNIKCIALKDFIENGSINSYKKKAIEIAIGEAKGDLVVTTDADCIVPPLWLETIASFYNEHKPAFICAPVGFTSGNSFLAIFQSLDFMTLQGITGASVNNNFHSMCNGANLAYEKKVFHEVGGFMGVDDIASGDDMLLMHKIATVHPTRVLYLKSPDVIVLTEPMSTVKDFLNQRIRWASKSTSYTDKKMVSVLALVYIFNVWLLLLGILSIFHHSVLCMFIFMIPGKIIVELFFLFPVASFFNNEKLLWWFPLAQPFHILYIIIAGWLGKFGTYQWKGRIVK